MPLPNRVTTKISFGLLLSVFAGTALAIPDPTIMEGTLADGQTVTIGGSQFGSKEPAEPLFWQNFNSGTSGGNVSDAGMSPYTSTWPVYSNTSPYGGGGLSVYNRIDYGDGHASKFATLYKTFDPSDELYFSFMSRYEGSGSTVYKNGRINTTSSPSDRPHYSGDGMLAISDNYVFFRPGSSSIYPEVGDGYPVGRRFVVANIKSSSWQRHQLYAKASLPAGTANGDYWVQIGRERKDYPDMVTRQSGFSYQYNDVLLGLMATNIDGASDYHNLYADDVYVDNTQARVELCDGTPWSAELKCDPQPPVQWNSQSIQVNVNMGAFKKGDTAYLYVVDSDGGVNSAGLEVVVGVSTQLDAATVDLASTPDAGALDGARDVLLLDAALADTGMAEAGVVDLSLPDVFAPDTLVADSQRPDRQMPDSSRADATSPDSVPIDATVQDLSDILGAADTAVADTASAADSTTGDAPEQDALTGDANAAGVGAGCSCTSRRDSVTTSWGWVAVLGFLTLRWRRSR